MPEECSLAFSVLENIRYLIGCFAVVFFSFNLKNYFFCSLKDNLYNMLSAQVLESINTQSSSSVNKSCEPLMIYSQPPIFNPCLLSWNGFLSCDVLPCKETSYPTTFCCDHLQVYILDGVHETISVPVWIFIAHTCKEAHL